MKYEDFEKFVREKCMYDTIYEDSDGRQILIIQMLDAYNMADKALRARLAQPEPAECDGGQCGIGGYCKQCPKTMPEPDYEAEFIKDWNEGKVRRVSDGKRMVPEREWVGLTEGETIELALSAFALPDFPIEARLQLQNELVIAMNTADSRMMMFAALIEAKLEEKNT